MGNDLAEQRKQEQNRVPMRNMPIATQKTTEPQGIAACRHKEGGGEEVELKTWIV